MLDSFDNFDQYFLIYVSPNSQDIQVFDFLDWIIVKMQKNQSLYFFQMANKTGYIVVS